MRNGLTKQLTAWLDCLSTNKSNRMQFESLKKSEWFNIVISHLITFKSDKMLSGPTATALALWLQYKCHFIQLRFVSQNIISLLKTTSATMGCRCVGKTNSTATCPGQLASDLQNCLQMGAQSRTVQSQILKEINGLVVRYYLGPQFNNELFGFLFRIGFLN